jgi:elongation factor Ts
MAVTAAMVKELREMTGVGMMECKKALSATDGDMDKAVEFLRENGLAAATKKAGRIASEGLTATYVTEDGSVASIVEVNSETDFVAKNQEFKDFVKQVAVQAANTKATDIEAFLNDKWELDNTITIKDALTQKIATIGENMNIRRFEKFEKQQTGNIVSYLHGEGRISVLIELACEKPCDAVIEAGKNCAMQIAALNPKFATRDEVSADFIEKEREVLKQQALNEGKPANIVDKMIEGRLTKELKEMCLVEQPYVKDPDLTITKYLETVAKEAGAPITVKRFVRFETGEGIEKKQEDFAAEVAKTVQG